MDELESTDIDDHVFLDLSRAGDSGLAGVFDVEVYSAAEGPPRSLYSLKRGIGFDRGTRFDRGARYDAGAASDQRGKADWGGGFDSAGDFDGERAIRIREEAPRPLPSFGREEPALTRPERFDRMEGFRQGQRGVEPSLYKDDSGVDDLTRKREDLEQELLRSQEVGIRSFKHTPTGFPIKIVLFGVTLLFLLIGTLRGLIPFRFYFFLTVAILILWNPMESLFISIIVALSAILAPLLG